jgi:flotillin
MNIAALLALGVILMLAAGSLLLLIKNIIYVCTPSEVLVFSGWRSSRTADGRVVGYRYIKGGRTLRVPLFERVDRLDLTNMVIEIVVRNAYSKGGIPLTIQAVANVKIPGEEPLLHASLERFLGKSRQEMMQVARETLEGNLRGVLATLTPEQVNQDKEAFARQARRGGGVNDLNRASARVVDTLKIQNVTDDVGYLDSIGRTRIGGDPSLGTDRRGRWPEGRGGRAEVAATP